MESRIGNGVPSVAFYFSCSDLFHSFEEIWAEETGAGEGLLVFPVVDLCSMA